LGERITCAVVLDDLKTVRLNITGIEEFHRPERLGMVSCDLDGNRLSKGGPTPSRVVDGWRFKPAMFESTPFLLFLCAGSEPFGFRRCFDQIGSGYLVEQPMRHGRDVTRQA